MFIDEVRMHLKAGKGGDGVVRWRHEKGKEFGGPSGGNGGRGGDIYAVAIRDLGVLNKYRETKVIEAHDGEAGKKDTKQGPSGEDIYIEVPVGTRIKNLDSGFSFELLEDGQTLKLLSGGRGGIGNDFFKSSVNVRPKESTPGEVGEEADFLIELLLIADFALIGLPNAGKSSLLNALTSAKAKVGAFPFTTLEPNLGVLYGRVLADIPGLIEGASDGKGLGEKFLKHIERTNTLLHLISCEETDLLKAYTIVHHEIGEYNKAILNKSEIILLTKTDLISKDELNSKVKELKSLGKPVLTVSILDDESIKSLTKTLTSHK